MFAGQFLTMDGAMYYSGESQPLSSPCSTADYSSYSSSIPAASAGQEGAASSFYSLDRNTTSFETGLSPPPYSWDSSAPLLLPPEGGSFSVYDQDPFLQEPLSHSHHNLTAEMANLEELSSWDFDEIKRVAISLGASVLEDQNEESASPFTWEEEARANGTANGSPLLPELSPEASDAPQTGAPVGKRGCYQRKTKMYQLGPQEDPEMEKRRKNAIKQHKKRERDERFERDLKRTLDLGMSQVNQLKEEKRRRQKCIAMLQEQLARLSVGQYTQYQNGGTNYFYQQ